MKIIILNRPIIALLATGAILQSCRLIWSDHARTHEAAIAKSVGAQHTTHVKLMKLPESIEFGTFNIRLNCGRVSFANRHNSAQNETLSEIVYTSSFERKPVAHVSVDGINRSGFEFNRSFAVDRSELTRKGVLLVDPGKFIQGVNVGLDANFAAAELKNEVIEVRAEYNLSDAAHVVWMGYLRPDFSLPAIFPRSNYGLEHKVFKLHVRLMNLSSGSVRSLTHSYDTIPAKIVIDAQWIARAIEQGEKKRAKLRTGTIRETLKEG